MFSLQFITFIISKTVKFFPSDINKTLLFENNLILSQFLIVKYLSKK
jgi:hypothetical protein